MKQRPQELQKEIKLYKHKIEGQVKFHEVDSLGVLHNIQYFYILEWARIKYLEYLGIPLTNRTFTLENPIMTVHHEIDYFHPAMLSDMYDAFSRVVEIKDSSMKFENLIVHENGKIMAKAKATLVYLNPEDYKPARIPDHLREKIKSMEGDNVKFIQKEKDV